MRTQYKILLCMLFSCFLVTNRVISQENQYIRIGQLWEAFDPDGGTVFHEAMRYPGANGNTDCIQGRDWEITAKDFTDISGIYHEKYVAKKTWDDRNLKYLRRATPELFVDGKMVSDTYTGLTSKNLVSDAKIITMVHTDIGITFTLTAYAWENQNHDDYMIFDFQYENTGYLGPGAELTPVTLHDVFFSHVVSIYSNGEGPNEVIGIGGGESDGDEWEEYIGETYADYVDGDMAADSLRMWYAWDGDAPKNKYGPEDTGDPDPETYPFPGRFTSPQYPGFYIIHADKSSADDDDDPTQPAITRVMQKSELRQIMQIEDEYFKLLTTPGRDPSSVDIANPETDNPPIASATPIMSFGPYEMAPGDKVHIIMAEAVGAMERDSCIYYGEKYLNGEIDVAQKNELLKVGKEKLFQNVQSAQWCFDTPSRSINGHRKKQYDVPEMPVRPGRMELTSGIRKVTVNWLNTPELVYDGDVSSGSKKIYDFAGYKLYRLTGDPIIETFRPILELHGIEKFANGTFPEFGDAQPYETYYIRYKVKDEWFVTDTLTAINQDSMIIYLEDKLFFYTDNAIGECKSGRPKSRMYEYIDTDVTSGVAYYYNITAFDDGVYNWEYPGQPLESSLNYFRTLQAIYAKTEPEQQVLSDKIRVVPNPYNKNTPQAEGDFAGNFPGEPDKITFFHLPGECTIKIYNVSGDLIKTIFHSDGTGIESWNPMTTDSNQFPVSGIYIYVVESDVGNATGKFVIVR